MVGNGGESWLYHNVHYYLIFKFVIIGIWERIQLFLISSVYIITVVVLTGIQTKGRKQLLRLHTESGMRSKTKENIH